MSVIIGHASCDERYAAHGGKAGDQTGKEVFTRTWYNGNWNKLIRAKDRNVAEKMARFCEAVCRGNMVGYDQYERNTLRAEARKAGWDGSRIATPCETDCSAFMAVCAEAAGIAMDTAYVRTNAPTTWTMCAGFQRTGAFEVYADSKYLTTDQHLQRGDILVRESGHTAMVLTNGALASAGASTQASSDSTAANTHTIVAGDTLWGISRKYGTTVDKLCELNGLKASSLIYPGQVIKVK